MPLKETRRSDTFIHFGLAATKMALDDAGFAIDESNSERVGVNVGSGIGGLPMIEDNIREMIAKGPRRISPFFVPGSIINMVAGLISIQFGAKGPNLSMVSACTTGSHCVGTAGRVIEYGDADVMIAGGTEATTTLSGVGGFCSCKALSERNDDPATASRPFDKDRDGFVLGEGAGVVILEEYEHARRRGARIYCELAGMGMSGDAGHITAPNMDGPRRAMLAALRNSGANPSDVQYVNAHGTSTPLGDANETAALKAAFGEHAYKLAVNSTKSMHGHLLGAAGGLEAVITALAIHHQKSPPTINLFTPDPACDLDYVANTARDMEIRFALSNSFGFGGTNGTLAFRRLS
jgi:3-oxoacyl-[acyl-carrier-protein] synthase II